MTIPRKQIAAKRRDNPTEVESLLWAELSGLKTAARFTRNKHRFGHLVDFYCVPLKLCVLIHDPQGRKEQRDYKRRVLANSGFDLLEAEAGSIRENPGALRVQVTRRVYELLLKEVNQPLRGITEVKDVRLDGPFKIHVSLGAPGTPEVYREIHETIQAFAPGAQISVQEEVSRITEI